MRRLLFTLALLVCGCDVFDTTIDVEYEVQASTTVDLTYENASGNTEQRSGVRPTWTYKFEGITGQFVYVSAQINGTGTVTVSIYANGKRIETAKSTGQFVIATASGSL